MEKKRFIVNLQMVINYLCVIPHNTLQLLRNWTQMHFTSAGKAFEFKTQ